MDYWQRIRQLVGKEPIIISSAACAILKDGKILLVRHGQLKKWQIPGGFQELDESIQQTARREIKEELGLDLIVCDLIGIYSGPEWMIEFPTGDKVQQLLFFFLMEGQVEGIKLQENEVTSYDFFAPDAIPEDTMDCCKQKVIDLMNFDGRTIFR